MNFKKLLAGLLALSTAALNVSVPISAEEVAETEKRITIAESIKTEALEEIENTADVPVAGEGRIESYEIAVYDPEFQLYRDANGNVILPEDHSHMVKDYAGVNIPSQYDSRTVFAANGYAFPEIKNQNPTGSCWAHAALAASEINGILKGVVSPSNCNFSEAHLNYFAVIGDKDSSSDLYGDSALNYNDSFDLNDYYQVYNNGGDQFLAASVLSRGTGPVYEPSEWDIGYAEDNSYVILDYSKTYPTIIDTVSTSVFYKNSNNYWCYNKNGTEIVLNGDPYYYARNVKNDLYFTAIDEQYRYQSDYFLQETNDYYYDYDASNLSSVDNIKEAIMEYGALTISYNANGDISSQNGYYYPEKAFIASNSKITSDTPKSDYPTNHAINVIGWDDSYSKDNFYCDEDSYQFTKTNSDGTKTTTTFSAAELRPQKDGAWLCRNSWGESYGDGGYFYISYEEPELRRIVSYDISSDKPYGDKIYQNYGAYGGYANLGSGHSIANIFTAEADDSIAAVSFFSFDYDTDYTVSVYTDASENSPMSGTLAAQVSGTVEHAGYHIVDLPSAVSISEGERFSVVLNTSDTKIFMDSYNKGKGISFISRSSKPSSSAEFFDAYSSKTNVCIKALTSKDKKPSAPTNLAALLGDGEALVYWTAVEGADSYNIYRVYSGSNEKLGSVSSNYSKFKGLTNGTAYQFAVTAVKGSLESDLSESVTVTANAGETLYKAPTGLSGTASDETVSLSWDAMKGAVSYKVYYYTSDSAASATVYTTVTTNSCNVTGLTNDTDYYFWVSAIYINGAESLKCSSVSATPVSSTGPRAKDLKAVPGDGQVTLSWSCQSNTTCVVYYGTTNDVSAAIGTKITRAQSITITGLTNGTRYYFWVKAGLADYSDVVSVTPTAASIYFTVQPTDVTVIGGTKFELTASAKANSMEWQYNDGTGWKKLPSASSIHFSDGIMSYTAKVSSSLAYKNCTFRCVASDSSGNSLASNTVKLSFYNESNVTVSMVTALDSTDLVNYVNYFTALNSGNFELTAAQLKAVELVLAADYAA